MTYIHFIVLDVIFFNILHAHAFVGSQFAQNISPGTRIFASIEEPEVILSEHVVSLRKPMGIILEGDESNLAAGVFVKRMDPQGQTAAACRSDPSGFDICIRDKVMFVNGVDVSQDSLESIMELIIDGPNTVEIVLGRPSDAAVVRWTNGISIAAKPGDSFGCIARHEALIKIPYSCASGACGTCEQSISSEDEEFRQYIRPCVARVPGGVPIIIVNPSDRFGTPLP